MSNEQIAGFHLVDQFQAPDANSLAFVYEHDQSGGRVLWLKNEDQNRAFGIGFITPPEDSRGAAHIVEHAVLAGSRKYPVKDPFMFMLKTSMNTFLNAMTFSDMTLYPVASMNEEDFHHLMDVYLDAVFFPRMLKERRVFEQEGWHLDLDEETGQLTYNGVVYNEMRGVYSSPDRTVIQDIDRYLHPDSTYAQDSGGYPYQIPDLTYEDFCAFHQAHYRPDNALAFLYGDLDIERALAQIDGDYFSHFQAGKGLSSLQTPAPSQEDRRYTAYYDGGKGDDRSTDSYLSYSLPFGQATCREDQYLLSLLADSLVNAESSPVRQAILEAGLAEDVSVYGGSGYYLDFTIVLERFDADRVDEAVALIQEVLRQAVAEGIDTKLLEAVIKRTEFALREAGGANRGVTKFIQCMSAWRYGISLDEDLNYSESFQAFRDKLGTGYYEAVVKDRLLGAKGRQILVHEPELGRHQAMDQALSQELADKAEAMTAEEIDQVKAANASLRSYQQTPDSPEAQATLPQLDITDVDREVAHIPEEKLTLAGGQVCLYHDQPAAGIRYVQLAFPLDQVAFEDLATLSDLLTFLGSVSTEAHAYADLDTAILTYANGLNFQAKLYRDSDQPDRYQAKLLVSFAALGQDSRQALALVEEILTASRFDEKARILNLLQRIKADLEDALESSGHSSALTRLQAMSVETARIAEELEGIAYYDHVCALLADFDKVFDDYSQALSDLQAKLWSSQGVTVSLTAEAADQAELVEEVQTFLAQLPSEKAPAQDLIVPLSGTKQEGIRTNGNVQYVVQGGHLEPESFHYQGSAVVLAHFLSHAFLHEQIREQGGAYGAGFILSPAGDIAAYSYRDPHLDRTLAVYSQIADFIRQLDLDQATIDQFIIGAMTAFHFPIVPQAVNGLALRRHFKGETEDRINQRLQEALDTKLEDFKAYADEIEQAFSQQGLVVIGNQDKIGAASERFSDQRDLKQRK
ncbi:insulinase family protein [Aerococcus sanguinicola]|uniref:insulinase family protein n=1 Tax=Aerococcus sanguinicola TaxID=119206 RepID=UPI0018A7383E|nr:insulinase family protein [Aerococcus sanguinicola]